MDTTVTSSVAARESASTNAGATVDRPDFWRLVESDVVAWGRLYCPAKVRTSADGRARLELRSAFKLMLNQCGLRAAFLYRLSHTLWKRRIPLLPGMIARRNLTLHGIDIPPSVSIGPGFYVPHPVGTVVFAKAIGANVTLVGGITIGMRVAPGEFPVIGDGVYIGAGARVLGGLQIGDGAKIGANAVVVKDVPPGATAVGIPAVIKMPGGA